jgi:hypothetical protein
MKKNYLFSKKKSNDYPLSIFKYISYLLFNTAVFYEAQYDTTATKNKTPLAPKTLFAAVGGYYY